ncbi:MAG: polysaccharide deacetylase family protein [Paracoccaceae bacterium]|nr:MAG: polysaccharide deacetylase family protein [Paracoccaceae bacterium]
MTADMLRRVLDGAAERGLTADLWLRDDDAVVPTDALDRLLALGVPVTVAAIPAPSGADLARRLAAQPGVAVAVHGWRHTNHAAAGEKAQELGAHRPAATVAGDLAAGFSHLSSLHGPRFVPMLVPPWNRISPDVVATLPRLGFRALSVFGPNRPGVLPQVNTQVDIIDWRGTRGGRPADALMAETARAVQAGGPVGILSHHLVHDGAAWAFLDALVAATRDHPGCRWLTGHDLV